MQKKRLLPIMIATGSDKDLSLRHFIYEPVLLINPARPITAPFVFERFRLTYTAKRIFVDVCDEAIDAFKQLLILASPPKIVLPGRVGPIHIHLSNCRRFALPCSIWLTARRRRRAMAGLRRR